MLYYVLFYIKLENMHELRLPNIHMPSHIIYYIHQVTIIIALAIKAIGLSKVRQTFSNIFRMHFGDIKDEI